MAKVAISSAECDAMLNELESRLARLRSLYEQYFLGIERMPPTQARKEVYRLVQTLENGYIRNTAQKFRMRSLVQRFTSYKTYWNRVEKAIENGTHTRDLKRASRNRERHKREEEHASNGPPMLDLEMEEVGDLSDFQAELEAMDAAGELDHHVNQRPKVDPAQAAARKQAKLAEIRAQLGGSEPAPGGTRIGTPAVEASTEAPNTHSSKMEQLRKRFAERKGHPGTDGSGLPTGGASVDKLREMAAHKQRIQGSTQTASRPNPHTTSSQRVIQRAAPATPPAPAPDQARAVYNKLLAAKKRCNESTSGLTYESVKTSMDSQRNQLKKDRGAKGVDFKVVIKNGKAFLKPDVKK